MNARLVGKRLLAQRFGLAQAPDIGGKAVLYIHADRQTLLQPINLQTMSDIECYLLGEIADLKLESCNGPQLDGKLGRC